MNASEYLSCMLEFSNLFLFVVHVQWLHSWIAHMIHIKQTHEHETTTKFQAFSSQNKEDWQFPFVRCSWFFTFPLCVNVSFVCELMHICASCQRQTKNGTNAGTQSITESRNLPQDQEPRDCERPTFRYKDIFLVCTLGTSHAFISNYVVRIHLYAEWRIQNITN